MTFWVAGAALVGTVVSGAVGSDASRRASNQQSDAANAANALQQKQYDQTREDQAPWRAAGQKSLDRLMGILGGNGEYSSAKFTPQDLQNDPGYKFQQEQGMRGVNNMADSFGIGGAALKSASRFNQGLADTSYNQAFNRYQTERTNTLNPLFQSAGFGPLANQQMQSAGNNYANNVGANMMDASNAQAGNIVNQGNIWSNAINKGAAAWTRPNQLSGYDARYGGSSGYYLDPTQIPMQPGGGS